MRLNLRLNLTRALRGLPSLGLLAIALPLTGLSPASGLAAPPAPVNASTTPAPAPTVARAPIGAGGSGVPDTMARRALACTGCHGAEGRSAADGFIPRIAGKPAGYLFVQLQAFRDGRRPHAPMARLLEHLDDAMLTALAEHFAGLDLPYPPPATAAPSGDAATRAERLVRSGDPERGVPACADCHGQRLTGIAPSMPGLLGLPRDYLLSQLGAWRVDTRKAVAPDCMRTVAHRLALDDIALLGQWLAAQPGPADARPVSMQPTGWPMVCGGVTP